MIPDFAGRTIDIARLDWGLHMWTEDNWEILLEAPVTVALTSGADGGSPVTVQVNVEPRDLPAPLAGVVGSTIQVKHWNDGQAEPTGWDSTDTDTDVAAPGQLHLSYVRGGSNTGGAKTMYIDDLTILGG